MLLPFQTAVAKVSTSSLFACYWLWQFSAVAVLYLKYSILSCDGYQVMCRAWASSRLQQPLVWRFLVERTSQLLSQRSPVGFHHPAAGRLADSLSHAPPVAGSMHSDRRPCFRVIRFFAGLWVYAFGQFQSWNLSRTP